MIGSGISSTIFKSYIREFKSFDQLISNLKLIHWEQTYEEVYGYLLKCDYFLKCSLPSEYEKKLKAVSNSIHQLKISIELVESYYNKVRERFSEESGFVSIDSLISHFIRFHSSLVKYKDTHNIDEESEGDSPISPRSDSSNSLLVEEVLSFDSDDNSYTDSDVL